MPLLNIPRQTTDYHLEFIDGELLLFHPGQTRLIACNAIASLIWQLSDGRRTTQEMVELLQAAYPEAQDSITSDVENTLRRLAHLGAIEFAAL